MSTTERMRCQFKAIRLGLTNLETEVNSLLHDAVLLDEAGMRKARDDRLWHARRKLGLV